MIRGEKPIELGDSWFSTKSIEVERDKRKKGVEHSMGKGGPKLYRSQGNSEYLFLYYCRQTLGAKVQSRKGKSPDRTLKSYNIYLVVKDVIEQSQPGGGLGSSHPLKKA